MPPQTREPYVKFTTGYIFSFSYSYIQMFSKLLKGGHGVLFWCMPMLTFPSDLYFPKIDHKPGKTKKKCYGLYTVQTSQKPRHLYLSFVSDLLNKIL